MNFEKYPFEKLNELLAGIVPNDKYELSALTIGEPKFETPAFIQDKLKETDMHMEKSLERITNESNCSNIWNKRSFI